MKIKSILVCALTLFTFSSITAIASSASNEVIRTQMYSVMKSRPYFNTNKIFIDKFVDELNSIDYDMAKAAWGPIGGNIYIDNNSSQFIDNMYYLVFKTGNESAIGLLKFRCRTASDGSYNEVKAYSYKRYDPNTNMIDEADFKDVESSVCKY